MAGLRGLMSRHDETFTLFARRGAGITAFRDLQGKRVDTGHPSSERQATMRNRKDLYGMKTEDVAVMTEVQTGPALTGLSLPAG